MIRTRKLPPPLTTRHSTIATCAVAFVGTVLCSDAALHVGLRGDYGLGFFGCSINAASFYVNDPDHGPVCYLCNLGLLNGTAVTVQPVDLYKRRVYLEPLALYLQLFAGTIDTVTLDVVNHRITVAFRNAVLDNYTFAARRLQIDKMSDARPGSAFTTDFPLVRGAFEIPASVTTVDIHYLAE